MMQLRGLSIDGEPHIADKQKFDWVPPATEVSTFSFMYLNGSVENGKLVGKWTAPSPSSTNGVLLWPDALEQFAAAAGYQHI